MYALLGLRDLAFGEHPGYISWVQHGDTSINMYVCIKKSHISTDTHQVITDFTVSGCEGSMIMCMYTFILHVSNISTQRTMKTHIITIPVGVHDYISLGLHISMST